jgi:hypothetical protein
MTQGEWVSLDDPRAPTWPECQGKAYLLFGYMAEEWGYCPREDLVVVGYPSLGFKRYTSPSWSTLMPRTFHPVKVLSEPISIPVDFTSCNQLYKQNPPLIQ